MGKECPWCVGHGTQLWEQVVFYLPPPVSIPPHVHPPPPQGGNRHLAHEQ